MKKAKPRWERRPRLGAGPRKWLFASQAMAAASPRWRPAAYIRHRPEQTVLYRLVQEHLETYLALAREGDWDGQRVPPSVEREFRRYLEWDILAYGYLPGALPGVRL